MSKPLPQLHQLQLTMQAQPDDLTCGPTCLHAVYRYFNDEIPLEQVIREAATLDDGGTLAVLLGYHALRRGYEATVYTYNLDVFDPTWFSSPNSGDGDPTTSGQACVDLVERLNAQMAAKDLLKLHAVSDAYIDFLNLGGKIRMQDLNADVIRRYLEQSIPILAGLSATYLYHCHREFGPTAVADDVNGLPMGHFVVLCGYDQQQRTVSVADPYLPNPLAEQHHYEVDIDRLVCAILLGVLTYDANLLIIKPQNFQGGSGA